MKTSSNIGIPSSRVRLARLLELLFFGVIAIFCVARVVVPAISPHTTTVRNEFTTGTAMAGAAALPGLHFGSVTAPYDDRIQTRYIYLRIGSKVWLYERTTTSHP